MGGEKVDKAGAARNSVSTIFRRLHLGAPKARIMAFSSLSAFSSFFVAN